MDIKYGRKRSGIKKELIKKIDEWLNSITDENVREQARKDVIVTGGSIASMLIGEQVNDWDIYFKTKQTTLLVAIYYVNKFKKLNPTAEVPVVSQENIVNIKGVEESRVTILITSSGIASEHESEKKSEEIYRPVFMSQNAITLSDKVQIIIRFYGEPEKIHDNYDFIHATCYWDHHKKELHLPAEALEALLSRTLVYHGSLYPIASIFRTKKFLERGWRITAGQQLKIMWQISEIDLSDPETLREQLTGVDLAYMYELIEALAGVDRSKINSTYVGTIIDKIFE